MKVDKVWGGGTRAVVVVATVMICCVLGPEARALDRAIQYGVSSAPYWKVGKIKPELSKLCRKGLFNQVFKDGLYIGYGGKDNAGGVTISGIAKRGFNLYDPLGKAIAENTYHFKEDGYSTCKVYEAIPLQGAPTLPTLPTTGK
ncbi:MAG: hypothetical protein K9H25_13830 [Rhodospirillum sp.]|nr:hypothetical protein [Rhodospirillum sp.]MCF8487840.1 hypothetical protein [Rhodospirillum sp.]MCF8502632.1 hypothetical protein [Rhodospirillum sp.]